MELFVKVVNGFQPLAGFAKTSILDSRFSSEYASDPHIFKHFSLVFYDVDVSNLFVNY